MAALCIWAVTATTSDVISVRTFSLVTDTGENVLHKFFDRRRLADRSIDQLALKFDANGSHFEFKFERSYPIFAPGTTIKMTRVSKTTKSKAHRPCMPLIPLLTVCLV